MVRDPIERARERESRLVAVALPELECPNRVPRVRAALACVQETAPFAGELLLELRKRLVVAAAREVDEAAQPVQRDGAEFRAGEIRGQAGGQLALGFVERLAGDVDGGRQPMGQ